MDIELAYTVNGEKSNIFPKKESLYKGENVECDGQVTAKWDNELWGLVDINNPDNEKIKCKVDFEITAVDYIKTIAQTETDELVTDDTQDANIRYIGKNPDNYVLFNGEKWRIIGVMNNVKDNETDSAPKSKIKIIKSELSTDIKEWDSGNKNDWNESSLQEYLNNTYYVGISEDSKKLISSSLWNLGGVDVNYGYNAIAYYQAERKTNVYQENQTTWTGNIGLMYASDFGFATTGKTCTSLIVWDWQKNPECANNDWLYNSQEELLINHSVTTTYTNVLDINTQHNDNLGGHIGAIGVRETHLYRPVVYLNSNVLITKGTGTDTNPYVLNINE